MICNTPTAQSRSASKFLPAAPPRPAGRRRRYLSLDDPDPQEALTNQIPTPLSPVFYSLREGVGPGGWGLKPILTFIVREIGCDDCEWLCQEPTALETNISLTYNGCCDGCDDCE